jgi:hypothetical protein
MPYVLLNDKRHFNPFGIVIQYNRKDKTYTIDEEEIEDQSVNPNDRCLFDTSRTTKEINCRQVYFLKSENHWELNIFMELFITNIYLYYQFTHQKQAWEDFCLTRSKTHCYQRITIWYLVALDKKRYGKTFGLDRISI